MTDSYGPYEGGAPWSEAQWMDFAYVWAKSGIIGTPAGAATSGDLAFSSSGLSVSAGTGKAWVGGTGFKRTGTPPTHTVTANAHATWKRRDRLVLRRDPANNQTITAVITGTPAASPSAPALTQNLAAGTVFELPLFSFLTPENNGTTITGVIDERVWLDPDQRSDATLGEAYLDAPIVGGVVGTPSWTDVLTVTAGSRGGECSARWTGVAINGNSGQNRTMSWRVVCDGVVLGSPVTGVVIPLSGTPSIARAGAPKSTPGPGSHTWKLQANADTAAAVVPVSAVLTVVER